MKAFRHLFLIFALAPANLLQATSAMPQSIEIYSFIAPPYVNHVDKKHRGFLHEIVNASLAYIKKSGEVSLAPYNRAVIESKRGGTAIFPLRKGQEEGFEYSDPLFSVRDAILSRKAARGRGAIGRIEASAPNDSDSIRKIIDMINSHRMDAANVDPYVTAETLRMMRSTLRDRVQIETQKSETSLHFAIPRPKKGTSPLIADFNRGLRGIKANGEYQKILEKYGYQEIVESPNVLNVLVPTGLDMEDMRIANREFRSKVPNARIDWHSLPEELLDARVFVHFQLDKSPFDVVSTMLDTRVNRPRLAPFPPASLSHVDIEDLYPSPKFFARSKDGVYGLPFRFATLVTYYRKDLFAKRKLVMPPDPQIKDLQRLATALHDPANRIKGICLDGEADYNPVFGLIVNTTSINFKKLLAASNFNSEPFRTELQEYFDLFQFGFKEPRKYGDEEIQKEFLAGRCAIWVDSTLKITSLLDPSLSPVHAQIGIATSPYLYDPKRKQATRFKGFVVDSRSTKVNLAQEFVTWTLSPAYDQLMRKKFGPLHARIGLRPSLLNDEAFLKEHPTMRPVSKAFAGTSRINEEAMSKSELETLEQFWEIWSSVNEAFDEVFVKVVYKKQTLSKALDELDQKLKALHYQIARSSTKASPPK